MEWNFRHAESGEWTWQLREAIRVHAFSSTHTSFGSVLSNAMERGFNPATHVWIVEDFDSTTRFAPGEVPQIIGK